jgi:hypothetical protein
MANAEMEGGVSFSVEMSGLARLSFRGAPATKESPLAKVEIPSLRSE